MLKLKLSSKEARTAIFNWIYEGYRKIMANGGNIKLGKDVIEAQREARDDSNSVRRWIRDSHYVKIARRDVRDSTWKPLKDWYSMYEGYCSENGEKGKQISRSVAKIFREKGFECDHRRDGTWFCIGVLGVDVDDSGNELDGNGCVIDEDLPF